MGVKKMCLLQWHSGRIERWLHSKPVRRALSGRRGWEYHASCSVNLLKIQQFGVEAGRYESGIAIAAPSLYCGSTASP